MHRLGLRPEAELEGVEVAQVLASALGSVPVPRRSDVDLRPRAAAAPAGRRAVVLRPALSTVWLWLLVVAAGCLLDLPARARASTPRPRPAARRVGPAGRPDRDPLVATNGSRGRLRGVVRDAWQPTAGATDNRHRIPLAPGDRVVLRTPLLPRRRGDLRAFGVTVRRPGRSAWRRDSAPATVAGAVRALPPFELAQAPAARLARLRELDGRAAVRVRGQGTEFDSLREYVRGDDVRSIDWRASARSRNVVVRTWQPERDRRVVLVLDTSRTSAGPGRATCPRLDSAMDAALLLAALATRAGDRIDFVAGDRRVRRRLRFAGNRDVAARLQETMADLDPVIAEADWSGLAGAVNGLGRQRALVVLLTPLEPSAIEEGLLPVLPALTRHHRVVLASVRDPELDRLAATRDHPRRGLRRRRRRAGDRPPRPHRRAAAHPRRRHRGCRRRRLPPALADHYLHLKARGLL